MLRISWLSDWKRRITPVPAKQRRHKSIPVETLEIRTYLSVNTLFANGELTLVSNAADSITVRPNPSNTLLVQVLVNGTAEPTVGTVQASQVQRLLIVGSDGNNTIDVGGVTATSFSGLTALEIDARNGIDVITTSPTFNDLVRAGDGDDVVNSGSSTGNLSIQAGDGNDVITTGSGNDTIDAGHGHDTVDGGAGNDSISAADGADSVAGGDGDDIVSGGDGTDTLNGQGDDDSINGDDGRDSVLGGTGTDILRGGVQNDTLIGDLGNDSIFGEGGRDSIDGSFGEDTLFGGSGADTLNGAGGDDLLNGSTENDSLNGGLDNDIIYGGSGSDNIDGDRGEDSVFGQGGADTVRGGADADSVSGGASNDLTDAGGLSDLRLPEIQIADVQVFEGDGFINLGAVPTSNTATNPLAGHFPAIGDFNGDGVGDLAVPQNDGNMEVFFNNGADVFTSVALIPFGSPNPIEPMVAVADDFNGDGLDDIAVTHGSFTVTDNTISVILNQGNGQFAGAQSISTTVNNVGFVVFGMRSADLDADGDVDLIGTNEIGDAGTGLLANPPGNLVFLENTGNGTFLAPVLSTQLGPTETAGALGTTSLRALAGYLGVGDLNGDGSPDVVVPQQRDTSQPQATAANNQIRHITIRLNDGSGAFPTASERRVQIPDADAEPVVAELADIDGDGDLDAVISDRATGPNANKASRFYVVLNNTPTGGSANFSFGGRFDVVSATGDCVARVLDANGDGAVDVIAIAGGRAHYFENNGSGNLAELISYPAGGLPTPGDFSGDGRTDFVLTESSTSVRLFRNNFIGPVTAIVTASLTSASATPVSVDFAMNGGLATAGSDFTPASGTLVFPPGVTSQQFSVPITSDLSPEGDENVFVNLTNPVGAVLVDTQAQLLIGDDDGGVPSPAISILDFVVNQETDDAVTISVSVTLSAATASPVTVDFETADGTALGGSDFVNQSGTITFPAGTTTASIQLVQVGDRRAEGDETFLVNLRNAVGAVIVDSQASITIVDDDGLPAAPLINDTVDAGDGNDQVRGSASGDLLIGGLGNDRIDAHEEDDTVYGGGGNDFMVGGDGDDSLTGNGGHDTLVGGAGDDTIRWRGQGDGRDVFAVEDGLDTVEVTGGSGGDNYTLSQSGSSIVVSQGSGSITVSGDNTGLVPGAEIISILGNNGNDTVTITDLNTVGAALVQVLGGSGDDVISAAGASLGQVILVIDGGIGDDAITGSADQDALLGGDGNDNIQGGNGNDNIQGGLGDDVLDGQNGNDTVTGDDGADSLLGSAGNDSLVGAFGNDTQNGGADNDTLSGGFGDDNLIGDTGNDSVLGQNGRDTLIGAAGNDTLDGGRNDDVVIGNSGHDSLRGDHGNDLLRGDNGNDTILGGDGDDTMFGGDGNDGLAGQDGNDLMNGDLGNDTMLGGDGNDVMNGGGGNDIVVGENGDDTLNGNSGPNDTLAGGQGADVIVDVAEVDEAFVVSDAILRQLGLIP